MNQLQITGGARVGRANASWPLAKLNVSRETLVLNAGLVGKFAFLPADVVSIEPAAGGVRMGNGLKINHTVPGYNNTIIFWTKENPVALMRKIEGTGFLTNKNTIPPYLETEVRSLQQSGGFPLKKGASRFFVLIWNLLFITGIALGALSGDMKVMQLCIVGAAGFILLSCLLALAVPPFAKLLLKEGRQINDLRPMLLFIMAILAFFTIIGSFVISKMPAVKAVPFWH